MRATNSRHPGPQPLHGTLRSPQSFAGLPRARRTMFCGLTFLLCLALRLPALLGETAQSTISWGSGQDDIVPATGTTTGGQYKLGPLQVQIVTTPGGVNVKTPEKQFTYKFDNTDTLGPLTRSRAAGPLSNTTTVTAQADMTIGKKPANFKVGTPVPYSLKLTAKSNTDLFSPDGYATATGDDPQIIDAAGIFSGMLSIGPGSSVFGTRPGVDLAAASFNLTAFDLLEPLASVDLSSGKDHVTAAVHFNLDPRLSFFRPGELDPSTKQPIPITELEVAKMLESDPYLGTSDGTLSTLNLFTYRYDLTGATLTPDAALGSFAASSAFSPQAQVPEPASGSLLLVGLAAMTVGANVVRRFRSGPAAGPRRSGDVARGLGAN